MILYPYLKCDNNNSNYETEYEHENESSVYIEKPQWEYELKYYIGYKPVKVLFPSFEIYRSFVQDTRAFFNYSGSYEYYFLIDLLPHLKRYNVLSIDYECLSNNRCNRSVDLNKTQISSTIIEWIDRLRYHCLTLEQFCSLDFNKYFNEIDRSKDMHFEINLEYLTQLHLDNKRCINKLSMWMSLSEIQKKHRLAKMEEQLRTDITSFAVRHFELTTKLNSNNKDRCFYITN